MGFTALSPDGYSSLLLFYLCQIKGRSCCRLDKMGAEAPGLGTAKFFLKFPHNKILRAGLVVPALFNSYFEEDMDVSQFGYGSKCFYKRIVQQ